MRFWASVIFLVVLGTASFSYAAIDEEVKPTQTLTPTSVQPQQVPGALDPKTADTTKKVETACGSNIEPGRTKEYVAACTKKCADYEIKITPDKERGGFKTVIEAKAQCKYIENEKITDCNSFKNGAAGEERRGTITYIHSSGGVTKKVALCGANPRELDEIHAVQSFVLDSDVKKKDMALVADGLKNNLEAGDGYRLIAAKYLTDDQITRLESLHEAGTDEQKTRLEDYVRELGSGNPKAVEEAAKFLPLTEEEKAGFAKSAFALSPKPVPPDPTTPPPTDQPTSPSTRGLTTFTADPSALGCERGDEAACGGVGKKETNVPVNEERWCYAKAWGSERCFTANEGGPRACESARSGWLLDSACLHYGDVSKPAPPGEVVVPTRRGTEMRFSTGNPDKDEVVYNLNQKLDTAYKALDEREKWKQEISPIRRYVVEFLGDDVAGGLRGDIREYEIQLQNIERNGLTPEQKAAHERQKNGGADDPWYIKAPYAIADAIKPAEGISNWREAYKWTWEVPRTLLGNAFEVPSAFGVPHPSRALAVEISSGEDKVSRFEGVINIAGWTIGGGGVVSRVAQQAIVFDPTDIARGGQSLWNATREFFTAPGSLTKIDNLDLRPIVSPEITDVARVSDTPPPLPRLDPPELPDIPALPRAIDTVSPSVVTRTEPPNSAVDDFINSPPSRVVDETPTTIPRVDTPPESPRTDPLSGEPVVGVPKVDLPTPSGPTTLYSFPANLEPLVTRVGGSLTRGWDNFTDWIARAGDTPAIRNLDLTTPSGGVARVVDDVAPPPTHAPDTSLPLQATPEAPIEKVVLPQQPVPRVDSPLPIESPSTLPIDPTRTGKESSPMVPLVRDADGMLVPPSKVETKTPGETTPPSSPSIPSDAVSPKSSEKGVVGTVVGGTWSAVKGTAGFLYGGVKRSLITIPATIGLGYSYFNDSDRTSEVRVPTRPVSAPGSPVSTQPPPRPISPTDDPNAMTPAFNVQDPTGSLAYWDQKDGPGDAANREAEERARIERERIVAREAEERAQREAAERESERLLEEERRRREQTIDPNALERARQAQQVQLEQSCLQGNRQACVQALHAECQRGLSNSCQYRDQLLGRAPAQQQPQQQRRMWPQQQFTPQNPPSAGSLGQPQQCTVAQSFYGIASTMQCGCQQGMTAVNGYCQCAQGTQAIGGTCQPITCSITGQQLVNGSCQCPTGTVVENGACRASGTATIKATVTCNPTSAPSGATTTISWKCEGATLADGVNFKTGGLTGGKVDVRIATSSSETSTTYRLTCRNGSLTQEASCSVKHQSLPIVVTASPQSVVRGGVAEIKWYAPGFARCAVSSPEDASFTNALKNMTGTSGSGFLENITGARTVVVRCTNANGFVKEVRQQIGVK